MPANLTPDYLAAEARYKAAKTVEEKLAALEEMLATVPKHKGTEKIQADIKARLAKMRKAPRKKGAARHTDPSHVRKEGAAQVAILGVTNTGKSQLVASLTKAEPRVAEYPYTTLAPQPAMMPFEDILLQLVDLPALGEDSPVAWVPQVARYADAGLVLLDLSVTDPMMQFRQVESALESRKVQLVPKQVPEPEEPGPVRLLPTLIVANRLDVPDGHDMLELLRQELPAGYEVLAVSALTGEGLAGIGPALYSLLELVRVYSKERGKKPETNPFVLHRGDTVISFAEKIHKDFVVNFQFAKVWGSGGFDGQRISRDYVVQEGDIIEIHT